MTRETIDYGIDLGTTNSAIATVSGVDATVIKNNDGLDTTPSAVWIDKRGRLYVGKAARERSELEPDDTCVEFKLRMGTTGESKCFASSGREMAPEQMSAEVLKSLKGDVQQRTGEDIRAAVITVPAAFTISACDATRRAAAAAGLTTAPLLQEPTAAALAYGIQASGDNVFWLAYDLGGGTFDAAVVHMRDGEFTVVKHEGDNFLGGKLIDWRIVEELLVPAVAASHTMPGLGRGTPRWSDAMSKLKLAAENAKVSLSRAESVDVLVDLKDDRGMPFEFEYTLTRTDVAQLAAPFLRRSVNLCRTALREAGLDPGDIEKVLLVGGPTLAPYVRDWLSDRVRGLGIPLDYSQDPLTVVARGAAIFARTQRLEPTRIKPTAALLAAELEYQPVGPDLEPAVGGRISGPEGLSLTGFAVELVNQDGKPPWRSGKIALAANGTFTATLLAEAGRANMFQLLVYDSAGGRREVAPDRLTYTPGVVAPEATLTHAIGIGLHNNEVTWLVERDTALPARRRVQLRTMVDARVGEGLIRIPVIEGEHARADRNRRIGRLEIGSDKIHRDVPEGSDVLLSIDIDASRLVTTTAYVPLLDLEISDVLNLQSEPVPRHEDLSSDARNELERLERVRAQAEANGDKTATDVLRRIDGEGTAPEVDALVSAARVDPDAATTCGKRLLDLRAAIDEAEDALMWPTLVEDAERLLSAAREVVESDGDTKDRDTLRMHEKALQTAISAQDADLLRQRMSELRTLALTILDRSGHLPKSVFRDLEAQRAAMSDQALATSLIGRGNEAMRAGDTNTLRNINRQLTSLFPSPPPPPDVISTVGRG